MRAPTPERRKSAVRHSLKSLEAERLSYTAPKRGNLETTFGNGAEPANTVDIRRVVHRTQARTGRRKRPLRTARNADRVEQLGRRQGLTGATTGSESFVGKALKNDRETARAAGTSANAIIDAVKALALSASKSILGSTHRPANLGGDKLAPGHGK